MAPPAKHSLDGGLDVRLRDAPPPEWPDLLHDDPGASPAQQSEVVAAFAAVLPGTAALWLVVEEAGRPIGGAAACVEHWAGVEWLHALPRLLPGAPVARPGRHAEVDQAVARALVTWLESGPAAGGEWVCYRPPGSPAVQGIDATPGETLLHEAALLDLRVGPDALRERVDRRERQQLAHARAAEFHYAEEPSAIDEVFALHEAQARVWRSRSGPPLALLRRLLEPSGTLREPAARLFTVRSRRLLGGLLALDHEHEMLAWWSGSHPAGRERSAARGLIWSAVDWAAAHGRARFNLAGSAGLAGVAHFKRSLGASEHRYPVRWLRPPRPSPGARLARALRGLRRGYRGEPA